MSYTSTDPEILNRNSDSSSLASTSTTASQLSKTSKKPWSKLKSSIKSIGKKMSSKPTFAEPTESSERKKTKKPKKAKETIGTSEVKPSTSEDKPTREKSPSKGPKGLIKKISVESISTPFVGYQPSSVSPSQSYAKAVKKRSGSTSESNLSASDLESPHKSLTLDKNTKYKMYSPESSDSGQVSQSMERMSLDDSRPASQITESATSDLSVDSDYTCTSVEPAGSKFVIKEDSLVAKTAHFAQSVVLPKNEKDKNIDVSLEFLKAETKEKPPNRSKNTSTLTNDASVESKKESRKNSSESLLVDVRKNESRKQQKVSENSAVNTGDSSGLPKSGSDEVEGKKKSKPKSSSKNTSSDLIKSEQLKPTEDSSNSDLKPLQIERKPAEPVPKAEIVETKPSPHPVVDPADSKKTEETNRPQDGPDKKEEESKSLAKEKFAGNEEDSTQNTIDTPTVLPSKPDKIDEKLHKPVVENSEEKASTSKLTPSSPAEKSPLSDFEPPPPSVQSSTQMSVEEKLEAFLSAEGWSGTIKDIADKPNADGSQQADKRECLYKILVIGELGTGKTSIIKRYVHQFFSQHYRATIGVDFALKVLTWDPNTIIRLQMWDIAGQERFGNMTRVYYKEAVGAFIVFDVTRSATFDAVQKWKQDLDTKVQLADGSPIPCVLLANKCDQQKEGIVNNPTRMDEYCKENSFSAWYETSAKENINIDEAAKCIVTQILQNDKLSQNGKDSLKDGKFPLDNKSEEEGRSCAC